MCPVLVVGSLCLVKSAPTISVIIGADPGIEERGPGHGGSEGIPPEMFGYFRTLRQLLVQSEAKICSTAVENP